MEAHLQEEKQYPVVVVGGSLVGLSTALFLAWRGIPSLVVEKHPGTSIHPRAGGFNARTMEIYRSVGMEATIRANEPRQMQASGTLRVETLAGKEINWYTHNINEIDDEITPVRGSFISQALLEPLLLERARELGAEVRFRTELVAFEQDAAGVTVTLKNRETGAIHTVRTSYLIAADGYKSPMRNALGIPFDGYGKLSDHVSIFFEADLKEALRGRHFAVCYVDNPRVQGVLGIMDETARKALFAITVPPGETVENYDQQRCIEALRAAIGIPDLDVHLKAVLHWVLASNLAERYQQGRIFLAGDAAHVVPPVGGFGANTGIQDAHNLAWKLALVLKGVASPALLTTYEAERRPVAELVGEQAFAGYAVRMSPHVAEQARHIQPIDFYTLMLGYQYHSAAIIEEPGSEGLRYEANLRQPSSVPGTRAPHVALERDGQRISTLDLFGGDFVLLTGSRAWCEAAGTVARRFELDLDCYLLGADLYDPTGDFFKTYGITPDGAVLVRPDGFIAWRSATAGEEPENTLAQIVTRILAR